MALTDDLLAYLAFNGDLTDATGNGNTGTNGSAAFATGKLGQALSVAGAGGRVDFTFRDLQSVSGTSPFTLAAWIKPSALPASYGQIVGNALGTPALYLKSDGFLSLYDFDNGSDHLAGAAISTGVWTHVVATYEATTWKVYVNGVLSASGTQANLKGSLGAVGGNPSFSSPFLGQIDEVGVWKDRALTLAEVVELYNAGAGLAYPFVEPEPVVDAIAPSTGPDEGGTPITITGSDFVSGATVTVGGEPATDVEFVDSTTLTAVTPAGSVGAADVVVTNPDDQTGTLAAGFLYTFAELTPEASAMIKLLPPGRWFLELGSQLRNLLRGIADEFKRIRLRGVDLINESDPRTAIETLEDWERVLSLPDDLVTEIADTDAERQVAVTQKFIGRGGSNDDFYEQLCAACGYPLLSIHRYQSDMLRVGFRVDDRVFGDVYANAIELELDTPTAGALTEEQFEAVVRARTHSHIQVVFTYS